MTNTPFDVRPDVPTIGHGQAIAELRALGVTVDQLDTVTGFGLRRLPTCQPSDTIVNKYAAGALTARGVMAVLYGADTPEHHAGTTDPAITSTVARFLARLALDGIRDRRHAESLRLVDRDQVLRVCVWGSAEDAAWRLTLAALPEQVTR